MVGERGLVISTSVEIIGTSMRISARLDPQELRSWLLFWDKLDFPTGGLIAVGTGPEGDFLAQEGILHRTIVPVKIQGKEKRLIQGKKFHLKGADLAPLFRAHIAAFHILDKKEPGTWSVASGDKSISFQDEDLEEGRGTLVQLHRAVPVPDKDVPLQDILEFRVRRRDELLALRHHLEDIYQRIQKAGDGALALNTETERLQRAISDHIHASREMGIRLRLSDISAYFNIIPIVAATASAYVVDLPLLQGLIPGAAASLRIGVGAALKQHSASPTPYKYVSSYYDELF